ncbi:MAG: inositol 2-dehydrogenase [Candidatus Eremiobacterota bacterium]
MPGIAVVGAGRIGELHARHLAGSIPGAELVCVVDPDLSRAGSVACGRPAFATLDEALKLAGVGAVVIASPTDLHAAQIEQAARAGKAIFCEKPVGLELARSSQALEAARDVPFQIGFQRRYDPTFSAAHKALQAGEIGKLEMLRSLTCDPAPPPREYLAVSGGIFRDMAIHDIDVARFFGGDVAEVTALGGCLVDPSLRELGDVDTAILTLRFASGALGVLQAWRRAAYGYDIRAELMGSLGKLVLEQEAPIALRSYTSGGVSSGFYDGFLARFREAYRLELCAFVEAVEAGRSPSPGPDDAVQSLRVALAAGLSLQEGRTVRLEEVPSC